MIMAVGLIPPWVALAVCWTGQAGAATYVVDQAATGAADTNTGTAEKPFKTVRHAADVVQPGDTVLVMAGKYDERVKIRTSGAEGQPITLRAMPRWQSWGHPQIASQGAFLYCRRTLIAWRDNDTLLTNRAQEMDARSGGSLPGRMGDPRMGSSRIRASGS